MVHGKEFAKVYQLRRQEGISFEGVANLPKIILTARDWGPLSRRGIRPPATDFGYKLIRSDLEDNRLGRELPELPAHEGELRERIETLVRLGIGRQPVSDDETMVWVDSPWFHGFSGLMICVNAVLIGLETEIKTSLWFWVEQALLWFFVFELVVRLMKHGFAFFRHPDDRIWNVFDFFIVLSGVCDQWVIPAVMLLFPAPAGSDTGQEGGSSKIVLFFMLMRMLRLLRIVRLFRLVRIVRPLYELAQGILEALNGMFWVLVFLVMVLYMVATLCTRCIGHGDFPQEGQLDTNQVWGYHQLEEIIDMFSTVEDSMFTLFGTMSSWSLLKFVPLFGEMPLLKPAFLVFYVYSAWALLAVMTGVVSENMIAIREQMLKEDEMREESRRSMVTKLLIELFQEADADKSGTVSKEEFEDMLSMPELVRKIEKNTHLKIKDLEELFDWLDHDGTGTITIDEFMKGFKWVNEPLKAKSLVKLQERLNTDLKNLETNVSTALNKRSEEVLKLVAAPLKKVHAITEQMQTLDHHFGGLRTGIKDQGLEAPSPQDVRDAECRLTHKLNTILRRLEEVENAATRAARQRQLLQNMLDSEEEKSPK